MSTFIHVYSPYPPNKPNTAIYALQKLVIGALYLNSSESLKSANTQRLFLHVG